MMSLLLCRVFLLVLVPFGAATAAAEAGAGGHTFEIENDQFLKDGTPFMIRSGSIHYSRVPRAYWADRLSRMKALGLNTVTTYVPWNWHAPSQHDASDWSGTRDLAGFLSACREAGLLVLLRPGPYICGEWEMGGFPAWLLNVTGLQLRTAEPQYLAAVDAWWGELLPRVKPHLYSEGGAVVIVQLENEYAGNCKVDPRSKRYMEHLYSLATTHLGIGVIYSTVSNLDAGCFHQDTRVLATVDGGLSSAPGGYLSAFAQQKAANAPGNSPPMWTELWEGWFTEWWEDTGQQNKSSADVGAGVAAMLEANGSFSLYMAHGGTNFGFWSGAEGGGSDYQPIITSYDYNAPIGEAGQHTIGSDGGDVYATIQSAIINFTGPIATPEPPPLPVVSYGKIELPEMAPLLASTAALSSCGTQTDILAKLHPPSFIPGHFPSMEVYGQAYGLILYQREPAPFALDPNASAKGLAFSGRTMHDRVQIFVDGAPLTTVYRPQCGCATSGAGSFCHIPVPQEGRELQLLVENMGRVNFGSENDPKGIVDKAPMTGNWSVRCLSLEPSSVRALPFQSAVDGAAMADARNMTGFPVFRRGTLSVAGAPKDTYLGTAGLTKGSIWVNGHHLGRFWETAGPQHALYCPAPFLQSGDNEIIVLDLHGAGMGGLHSFNRQQWRKPGSLPPPLPAFPATDACERFCAAHVVSKDGTPDCCQCDASASGAAKCQSSSQIPSCAMGCAAANVTATLQDCENACRQVSCDFKVSGKIIGDTCGTCPCGCKPAGDFGDPTHNPDSHNVSGCIAGCRYSHGLKPVPPPPSPFPLPTLNLIFE